MADPADQIIDIYRRHADAYDRQRSRALFERDWLDRFARGIGGARSVLDLGCGTAEPIDSHLISCGCRITGVDTSPGMLAHCKARFPDHTWINGDMRTLDLGRPFDGIIAWDSFFLLRPEDQRSMFTVFKRHSRPGTQLLFTSGPSASEKFGRFEGEPIYSASLDPAEYQALLRASGFEVVNHVAEDPACDFHTVWLARVT